MKERLFSPVHVNTRSREASTDDQLTCKLLGIFCRHSTQVSQITLVSNEHDDNVGIGMVTELLQPPVDIVIGLVLADVVNEQRTDRTAVVGRCNGTVPLLTGSIPDLSLDGLGVDLDGAGRKLDTDRRLRVKVELISSETTQQVRLSDTRVSDKDNWNKRTISNWPPQRDSGKIMVRRKGPGGETVPLKRN